ncbi:MAG TPA: CDP-glycerol glycerophosphotransferase family protein [Clostridiales bacterium]|nr:CDP-glycerol glycerophosphotransferase family protein [Clostridiales bacterium]
MGKTISFPFFYGLHQLYHSALIAFELSKIGPENNVICLSSNKEQTDALKKIAEYYPETKTQIIQLRQPFRYKYLNFKRKSYPSVNAVMKIAKPYLSKSDCILTTSHGTPKMLAKNKITGPILIYQYHGCGDRRYGFDPGFKRFDHMLLPGNYHQKRLIEENIIKKENTHIIGWPKFDYSHKINKDNNKLFNNGNPVVLYTPHWEPALTSFRDYSELLLKFFRKNRQFNFIFAPHVLIKHWKTHYGYRTDFSEFDSDNIIIDFGSTRSTDGTYLNNSDVYIGDVSSMVYEFIAFKPRPCFFINAHGVDWKNNPDYRFWEFGYVINSFSDFESVMKESVINNNEYKSLQENRIREYFSLSEKPSSLRAAEAITSILKNSDTNNGIVL